MTPPSASTAALSVEPITGSFGAVVHGLDLRSPDDRILRALHRAVVDHGVVVVPDQQLDDEQHLAVARSWGELQVYPPFRLAGQDVPLEWVEDTPESPPKAFRWHTDLSWEPTPPKFGLLWAQVVPDAGGDTIWADTAAAHDALSPTMQELLAGLTVRHRVEPRALERLATLIPPDAADAWRRAYAEGVEHPLVRVNADSGRRALFLAGYWMDQIVGMHRAESDALLQFLMDHASHPRFQCRWRWRVRDLVVWDERRTMHLAMPDHYPRHRLLRRCTVVGEPPVGIVA